MNVDWAKRCRIKEAYGFAQTEFTRLSWRRALNLSDDYHFEDTKGVFPLENYPDERTSFYHGIITKEAPCFNKGRNSCYDLGR